jgi:hypothetical protein
MERKENRFKMWNAEESIVFGPTNSVVPEPEGSSPYLQEPATDPYPEPAGSNLHFPIQCP